MNEFQNQQNMNQNYNNQQNQFNQPQNSNQNNWNAGQQIQYGSPQWWQMVLSAVSSMITQQPRMPQNNNQMNQQAFQQPSQPVSQPVNYANTSNQISLAKIISSTEDIKPSDIPVDDTVRIFMTDDLQTIYAKKWDNNGELNNMVFQRVHDEPKKVEVQQNSDDSRMNNLENKFEELLGITTDLANKISKMETNNPKSSTKKGVTSNE